MSPAYTDALNRFGGGRGMSDGGGDAPVACRGTRRVGSAGASRSGKPGEPLALVLGSGDIGSAVARALYLGGWPVVVLDRPWPAWHRRGMAYVDAAYGEAVALDSVWGIPAGDTADATRVVSSGAGVAVTAGCRVEGLVARFQVGLIVDARMRKHLRPDPLLHLGPFTVGLGPNFVVGEHVHAVVETAWGPTLGCVAWQGAALPLAGEPRPIAGVGRERFLYSPVGGQFRSLCDIGRPVEAGQPVAVVGGCVCTAKVSGTVRGISHAGARVEPGTKVFEVDPRGEPGPCFGVGERPRRIADGVFEVTKKSLAACGGRTAGESVTFR
jgi:xanthine dehydrogenase accessory factor